MDLHKTSIDIRKKILEMVTKTNSSHIGSAYSIVDILTILYFKILHIDTSNPYDEDRDRFILSKGHAASALYAVLSQRGFFPEDTLNTFCQNGSTLTGHPFRQTKIGIEFSAGSLGHGLSFAVGQALSAKKQNKKFRVYTLLGDGECNEGSVWEAILSASALKLDNLVAIVDYNKLQGYGRSNDVLKIEPLLAKWESFGWGGIEINGHDHREIEKYLLKTPFFKGKPTVIIAHTVKGKGVSFMEDRLEWHYKSPSEEQRIQALVELNTMSF